MLPETLSTTEKRALKEFKQKLYERLPGQIEFVRLYGSKARGDAGKHSDIDILIVTKKDDKGIRDKITTTEVENMEKYGLPLSGTVMSKKHYEKELSLPTLFIQFVQKEGVDL